MYSLIEDIKWENDGKFEKLIFVKKERLRFSVNELGKDPDVWTHEIKKKNIKANIN